MVRLMSDVIANSSTNNNNYNQCYNKMYSLFKYVQHINNAISQIELYDMQGKQN